MGKLSAFHKLVYAGVDVSSLSGEVTAHPGFYSAPVYHSSQHCWGTPRPEWGRDEKIERTSVVASKACGDCFDSFFVGAPGWSDFRTIVSQINDEDARFLRTALKESSKKNTPEALAARASRLNIIKSSLLSPSGDEGRVAYDALVRRIDDRVRAIRSKFSDTDLRDQVHRTAWAFWAAFEDTRCKGELRTFEKIASARFYLTKRALAESLLQWAGQMATDIDLDESLESLGENLRHLTDLDSTDQLDFYTQVEHQAGESVAAWSSRAWTTEIARLSSAIPAGIKNNYLLAQSATDMVLAHLYVYPSSDADNIEIKTAASLVEMYGVYRKGAEVVVWMPRGLYQALKLLLVRRYNQSERAFVEADGIDEATAHTAASLYNFEPYGNMGGLKGSLAAARALNE